MKTKKFKPILFSTEMVQAILAGRKTQTRRVCQHQYWQHSELVDFNINKIHSKVDKNVSSKYQPGDILWVRETSFEITEHLRSFPLFQNYTVDEKYLFKADATDIGCNKWKPSIFMPKEAARIFLEVTDVRVERLQDISENDAIAEGIAVSSEVGFDGHYYYKDYNDTTDWPEVGWMYASSSFETLWQSINAKKHPWEFNPWVWVYDFERIEKPENFN